MAHMGDFPFKCSKSTAFWVANVETIPAVLAQWGLQSQSAVIPIFFSQGFVLFLRKCMIFCSSMFGFRFLIWWLWWLIRDYFPLVLHCFETDRYYNIYSFISFDHLKKRVYVACIPVPDRISCQLYTQAVRWLTSAVAAFLWWSPKPVYLSRFWQTWIWKVFAAFTGGSEQHPGLFSSWSKQWKALESLFVASLWQDSEFGQVCVQRKKPLSAFLSSHG